MTVQEIFKFMRDDIHTVVAATVDGEGLPEARVIDIMLYDEGGIYILTAKGKRFYDSLTAKGYIALSGFKGEDTMKSVAVSVSGKVTEVGYELVERVFEENPYMAKIYPTPESRRALTVFKVYCGKAEYFDLSKKPIERYSFSFGGDSDVQHGYFVTDKCTACGKCTAVCPQSCIDIDEAAHIRQSNCLHCGSCAKVCPMSAIERR